MQHLTLDDAQLGILLIPHQVQWLCTIRSYPHSSSGIFLVHQVHYWVLESV
jgi:hypothetical protein